MAAGDRSVCAKENKAKVEQHQQSQRASAERAVRQALAEIDSAPRQVAEAEEIKMARQELTKLTEHSIADPPKATQKAKDALDEIQAIKEKIKDANKYAVAQNEIANLKNVSPPSPEETGPVADAQRVLAAGKLEEAVDDLKKTVDKFDKMDKKEQEKAADQMKNLADQIAKQANDPEAQREIQDQLDASRDEPAAGAAAEWFRRCSKPPTAISRRPSNFSRWPIRPPSKPISNRARARRSRKPCTGDTKSRPTRTAAGEWSGGGAADGTDKPGAGQGDEAGRGSGAERSAGAGQGGRGQSGKASRMARVRDKRANKPRPKDRGRQVREASPARAGKGAQQQMQQRIRSFRRWPRTAQAVAAGQQGQGQGQGQQPGGQGQGPGQQANGQWGQGNQNNQQGNPQPQQGQGNNAGGAVADGGRRPDPVGGPFAVKKELSQSQTNEDGKILASSFVKAPVDKGTSHVKLSDAIASESKEAAEEVEQDRIPRGSQRAVKAYFDTLKNCAAAVRVLFALWLKEK